MGGSCLKYKSSKKSVLFTLCFKCLQAKLQSEYLEINFFLLCWLYTVDLKRNNKCKVPTVRFNLRVFTSTSHK